MPAWTTLLAVLLGSAGLALFLAALDSNFEYVPDDTYITLRYAANVAAGHGPVWNPGGDRVEGFSSFSAVFGVAGLLRLGVDALTAARLLNLLGVLLVAAATWAGTWRMLREHSSASARIVASTVAAMSLSAFPLAIWVQGGLETPLYAGLVAVGAAAFASGASRPERAQPFLVAGLAFALACLTRLEAALLVACCAAVLATSRAAWRSLSLPALVGPPLAAFCALMAWRWMYFGELLPNSYVAKAIGLPPYPDALGYFTSWLLVPPYPLLFAAVALLIALSSRRVDRAAIGLAVLVAAVVLPVVRAGGDHMQAHRMFLAAVPLCWLVVGATARAWGRTPLLSAVVGALLLVMSAAQLRVDSLTGIPRDDATNAGELVGRFVSHAWPPGSLVALNTAGTTPFFAPQHEYIDMLGLNDHHIARRPIERFRLGWQQVPGHSRGDGAYVLAREPDYIILGPASGSLERPMFLSDLEILESPILRERYRPVSVWLTGPPRPGTREFAAGEPYRLRFRFYERLPAPAPGPVATPVPPE